MLKCLVWNTPATEPRESTGDWAYFDSPRAGGKYKITGSAIATLPNLDVSEKARLTTWLCDQRRSGVEYPSITSDVVNAAKSFPALITGERINRALLYFSQFPLGTPLITPKNDEFDNHDSAAMELAARAECITKRELLVLLGLLTEMNLIANQPTTGLNQFAPTASGWLKIDDLGTKSLNTTQAFVAMWFNDSVEAAFVDGIKPAIEDCGYRAVRIDKIEHSDKIDDRIIAEIRRSRFLVADFTCEKEKVRGGVYFEAGFAQGLGIPVIWTAAKDSLSDVHFDTRQYNHIVWDTPANLRTMLKARIGAVIGDGPLKLV